MLPAGFGRAVAIPPSRSSGDQTSNTKPGLLQSSFKWLLVLVLVARVSAALPAFAQVTPDSVVIQPTGKVGRVELKGGSIRDFNSDWLYYQPKAGKETQRIKNSEVVSVTTSRVSAHQRAIDLIKSKRFAEAETEAEAALSSEKRAWVRREILALMIKSQVAQGKYESAGDVFLALIGSQSRNRFVSRAPLAWAPLVLDPNLKSKALVWLSSDQPWARLLGASLLLDDPVEGGSARDAMETLASNSDRRLSLLAEAQTWRIELAKAVPSDYRMLDWQAQADRMPAELRGGAMYLIGRAHSLRHEHDRAAIAFLWVPLVYGEDELLSARAMLDAADSLVENGQRRGAERLYRELITRYSQTSFARDAAAAMNDLNEPSIR